MSSRVVDASKHFLGRGRVYFNCDVCGAGEGEDFLGNCTQFNITPADTRAKGYDWTSSDNGLVVSTLTRREYTLSIEGYEYSKENFARFLSGDVSALAQGSGAVTNEAHADVIPGRHYKTAKRNISALVVTGVGGSPTYTVTTDYILEDAVTGLVYIVPGGGITTGTDIEMDYSYGADTSPIVRAGTLTERTGFIRFIGKPAKGPIYEAEVWKVNLGPDGDLQLITDDYGKWKLIAEVMKDSANHPTVPFFQVIERSS